VIRTIDARIPVLTLPDDLVAQVGGVKGRTWPETRDG
jgi:hypothetical protein